MTATLTEKAEYYAEFYVRRYFADKKENGKKVGTIPFVVRQLFLFSPENSYCRAYRVTRVKRNGTVSYSVFRFREFSRAEYKAWLAVPEAKWEKVDSLTRDELKAFLTKLGLVNPERTVFHWETLPATK